MTGVARNKIHVLATLLAFTGQLGACANAGELPASGNKDISRETVERFNEFVKCMNDVPSLSVSKTCGAYVGWGPDIKELKTCLQRAEVAAVDEVRDRDGNAARLIMTLSCASNREIAVTVKFADGNPEVYSLGVLVH